jgi:nucleoside-diphosphate-sugar epimerase
MTVLVTGSTGFIGHSLVETLLDRGTRVRCLVRSRERARALQRRGAELVLGDVDTARGIEESLQDAEAVVHLAGVVRAWTRHAYLRTNEHGTRVLARAARAAGVRKFVLVSSLAALGPAARGGEVTESTPPRPVNAYGASKLAGEKALAEEGVGMPWVIVRPCVVYGPRDRDVLALFRMAARGWAVYSSPRGARLSLIHVSDLVALILLCLDRAAPETAYLASDGEAHTWPEIAGCLGGALGRRVRVMRIPPWALWPAAVFAECLRLFLARPPLLSLGKIREAVEPCWVASCGRACADLGWSPRISLERGVRNTLQWYRENNWL